MISIWKALWRNLYRLLQMLPKGSYREQIRSEMRNVATYEARNTERQKASKA